MQLTSCMKYIDIPDLADYHDALAGFYRDIRVGRMLADARISLDEAIAHEIEQLAAYAEKNTVCFAFTEDQKLAGYIGYRFSAWDTDVFGPRIAKIDHFAVRDSREAADGLLAMFHRWVADERIEMAITRVDARYFEPVAALQQEGYGFYECVLTPTLDLTAHPVQIPEGIVYRSYRPDEVDLLSCFAVENTYRASHFYLDERLDRETIDQMYGAWIKNAMDSDMKFVILEEEGEVSGFFIYGITPTPNLFGRKHALWSWAAVSLHFRGKGVGKKLFYAAVQSCLDHGITLIDSGVALKNNPSLNLHLMLGFQNTCSRYTFHRWFD